MNLLKMAGHVERSYDQPELLPATHKIDTGDVRAYCLIDKTIVVPGTDQISDWWKFNLKTKAVEWEELPTTAPGASGALWHEGFLTHAKTIYKFAQETGGRRIIGHSLGGASAQIAGASLNLPVVTFGSPAPKLWRSKFPGEHRVANITLSEDPVANLRILRWVGFRNLGETFELPVAKKPEVQHSMKTYISIMRLGVFAPFFPKVWTP